MTTGGNLTRIQCARVFRYWSARSAATNSIMARASSDAGLENYLIEHIRAALQNQHANLRIYKTFSPSSPIRCGLATSPVSSDVLQPQKASLDAGPHQPNAVRAKLVCGTVEGCRIMRALRDTEFRGKVISQMGDHLGDVSWPRNIGMSVSHTNLLIDLSPVQVRGL